MRNRNRSAERSRSIGKLFCILDSTRNQKPETFIYFPFHTGARFSAKARGPSLLSSVVPTNAERSDSSLKPSSKRQLDPFLIASLINNTDIGAPLRILPAKSSAAFMTSRRGHGDIDQAQTQRFAAGDVVAGETDFQRLRDTHRTRQSLRAAGAPESRPRFTSARPSLASSAATRMSQANANSRPPPTQ